jgi:hypothetical protein
MRAKRGCPIFQAALRAGLQFQHLSFFVLFVVFVNFFYFRIESVRYQFVIKFVA